ncbi:MAG: DUF512 domain-containing protein [Candidatus Marinimicrobia bacterium]|nr:DUF512 domain-containing protein [Candidatus Neomarinimicrobiota bacterium]
MKIIDLDKHGLGARLGMEPGDEILRINDHRLNDIIDYEFYVADETLEIEFNKGGKMTTRSLTKDPDHDLGLQFKPMRIRACANDCIFCFADQNPPGVRESLNFRDGDYRFSFLHGHFVTMTNMGQKQLDRVVEQRLSPLYVSVHVTDPTVRRKLMLFGKDDRVLEKLKFLTDNGIELHTQIVLCPGYNDGDVLFRTIDDLYQFQPMLKTVSIVPVGLTKWRQNLPNIPTVSAEYARQMIPQSEKWDAKYRRPDGQRFVYLSDEWFILADAPMPASDYYDDYLMVENGVGQCRAFADDFRDQVTEFPERLAKPVKMTFATGTLPYKFLMQTMSADLNQVENLAWDLVPITNDWLGAGMVTVTGLLSGRDVSVQLKSHGVGDVVWLSHRMFNEDGLTLDDLTRADIEKYLGVPVKIHQEDMAEVLTEWA